MEDNNINPVAFERTDESVIRSTENGDTTAGDPTADLTDLPTNVVTPVSVKATDETFADTPVSQIRTLEHDSAYGTPLTSDAEQPLTKTSTAEISYSQTPPVVSLNGQLAEDSPRATFTIGDSEDGDKSASAIPTASGDSTIAPQGGPSSIQLLNSSLTEVAHRAPSYINADVESELERAVEIDPTVDHELLHNIINDEEEANNLISDAIMAESIIALTSVAISSSSTTATVAIDTGGNFAEGDLRNTAIIESSLEAHEEAQLETQQESQKAVVQEVVVEDDVTYMMTDKKWESSEFLYISEAEDRPDKEVDVAISTEEDLYSRPDMEGPDEPAVGGVPTWAHGQENEPRQSGVGDSAVNDVVYAQAGETVTNNHPVNENLPNGHRAVSDEDKEEARRHPEGASENGDTDLETTQDMTDSEQKNESQYNKDVLQEDAVQEVRNAVLGKEAVLAAERPGLKKSPSDAVLRYQERKNKFGRRESGSTAPADSSTVRESDSRTSLSGCQVTPLIGFKAGRVLLIEGIIEKSVHGFTISLQTEESQSPGDVALMFSANFSDRTILCNTYSHHTWGPPQIHEKFPFKQGKFLIKIASDSHCFKISVNGHRILDYDHRIPLDRVHYLRTEGDAVFNNVECPFVLDLPYVLDVDHGFRADSGIKLDAFVWPTASMFELNLLCGKKAKQTHASFLMKVLLGGGKARIEMKSFCNDRMGDQHMVEGDLNILPGHDIRLRILLYDRKILIEAGEEELAMYEHDIPIEQLGHVLIDGDISLYSVRFLRPSRRASSALMLSTALNNDSCCQCAIT